MRSSQKVMSPLDVVVLLKITTYEDESWHQIPLAENLHIIQSEVSKSLARSKYAGLLDVSGKKVFRLALMELLQYGIRYVFPQQPGPIVRGVPTAHSAPPLKDLIRSNENYVWPSGRGTTRGQSIIPLYSSVTKAVQNDLELYELLVLVDALRVGRAREKEIAVKELRARILDGK